MVNISGTQVKETTTYEQNTNVRPHQQLQSPKHRMKATLLKKQHPLVIKDQLDLWNKLQLNLLQDISMNQWKHLNLKVVLMALYPVRDLLWNKYCKYSQILACLFMVHLQSVFAQTKYMLQLMNSFSNHYI